MAFVPDLTPPSIQSPLYNEQVRIIQKIKSSPIEEYYDHVEATPEEPLYHTVQYSTKRTLIKLKSRASQRCYLAKVFKIDPSNSHAYQKASREITLHVLAAERCPNNILGPRRIFYNQAPSGQTWLYFVVDYWPLGTLYDLLKDKFCRGLRFRTAKIKQFIKQIAQALYVMHIEMRVAHRDIKPENILVGANMQLYLCDFGFAKQVYHTSDDAENRQPQLITPVYSRDYASPEIVKNVETPGGTPYDMKCDVWALGIIAYVFHTGRFPFYASSAAASPKSGLTPELRHKIKQGNADWEAEVWKKDGMACDLVRGMLRVDPESRLSVDEVLAHPWFSDVEDVKPIPTPNALEAEHPIHVNNHLTTTLAAGDSAESTTHLRRVSEERLMPKQVYQTAHGDLSTLVLIDGRVSSGHRRTDSGLTTITEATDIQRTWQAEVDDETSEQAALNRMMEAHLKRQRSIDTMPKEGILNIKDNPLYIKRRAMSLKRKEEERRKKALENYRNLHKSKDDSN